jgi:hypothetical protein
MYSPKIREELIPKLWRLARTRKVPMTKLVNGFIEEALVGEDIPETVEEVQRQPNLERTLKRKEAQVRRILREARLGK